jgi:tight adherence protein C
MLYAILIIVGGALFSVLKGLEIPFKHAVTLRLRAYLQFNKSQTREAFLKKFLPQSEKIQAPAFLWSLVTESEWIQAGIGMEREIAISYWWLIILSGICCGSIAILTIPGIGKGILIALFLNLVFLGGPLLYLRVLIKKRRKKLENDLPYFLDMLALSLEAGLGFLPALKRANKGIRGPLKEETQFLIVCFSQGYTKRAALDKLIAHNPSDDMKQFAQAVLLSDQLGTSLARTIHIQSDLNRVRRRRKAETRAKTAPIRIIPALVFFFLPALLLIYLAPPILKFLNMR